MQEVEGLIMSSTKRLDGEYNDERQETKCLMGGSA